MERKIVSYRTVSHAGRRLNGAFRALTGTIATRPAALIALTLAIGLLSGCEGGGGGGGY